MPSFYGVCGGHSSGVYDNWSAAEKATKGVAGAKVKKFKTEEEARVFANAGNLPSSRVLLNCPFEEKDAARALGAQWDAAGKTWWVAANCNLAPFARWLPAGTCANAGASAAASASAPVAHGLGGGSSSSGGIISGSSFGSAISTQAAAPPPLGATSGGVEPGELALFTDGACKNNQAGAGASKPAGWGVVVVEGVAPGAAVLGGREVTSLHGPVIVDTSSRWFLGAEGGTNNTGELCGVCEALLWLLEHEPTGARACICCTPNEIEPLTPYPVRVLLLTASGPISLLTRRRLGVRGQAGPGLLEDQQEQIARAARPEPPRTGAAEAGSALPARQGPLWAHVE